MLVLRDPGIVPPGGQVRYIDPDDGELITHPYYQRVKILARKHRIAHGFKIADDFDRWFEEQVCIATPGACVQVGDAPAEPLPGLAEMARTFTGSMVRWARSGLKVVDYETYKARYAICSGDTDHPRCSHYREWSAFGLMRCGKCGCVGVKLFLGTEKCPIGKW